MEDTSTGFSSAFCQELLQYEMPRSGMIPNVPRAPGHANYLVIDAFTQGLLPGPFSKKMQGWVPSTRHELKFRVEVFVRKLVGQESKEANLKAVFETYIKKEPSLNASPARRERRDDSHDKHHRHSRYLSCRFQPLLGYDHRSHRIEIHMVEKSPPKQMKERTKYCEYHKSKTHDTKDKDRRRDHDTDPERTPYKEISILRKCAKTDHKVIEISDSNNVQSRDDDEIDEAYNEKKFKEGLLDGSNSDKCQLSDEDDKEPSECAPSEDEEESGNERDFDKYERQNENPWSAKVYITTKIKGVSYGHFRRKFVGKTRFLGISHGNSHQGKHLVGNRFPRFSHETCYTFPTDFKL
ncbi:hypothetical protein LXL04_004512 [Taraxacum kok-saghyz]